MLQQLNYIENVIIIISIISKWGKIWKSFGENKSKEEVKHYPAVQASTLPPVKQPLHRSPIWEQ